MFLDVPIKNDDGEGEEKQCNAINRSINQIGDRKKPTVHRINNE